MSSDECTRPSLGRMAKIGDLYDVRTEKLMLSNIFKDNINEYVEHHLPGSNGLRFDSFFSTKTSEKLRKIGIDADASLSLLCGTIDAAGSVDFVKDKECSERAMQCNIIVQKTTKKDQINFKQTKLQEFFEFSGHEHATHVVAGITWGANATITVTNFNNNNRDKKEVEGKISVELKKLQAVCSSIGDISSHLNVSSNDNAEWKNEETKIAIYTDVASHNQSLPQNMEDAKKFIETIVAEVTGQQQIFHLFPIVSLKNFLHMNQNLEIKFTSISLGKIQKIESLFDEINESYGEMKVIWEEINGTTSIPRHEKIGFQKHLQDMSNEVADIKDDIRELILKIRQTHENSSALDQKYASIQETSIASRLNFHGFLEEKKPIIERAKFLREFTLRGAKTAEDECRLSEIMRNNVNKNIYILFCSFERERSSDKISTFCKLIAEQKSHDCFIVVETDLWNGNSDEIPPNATIQLIVDGKLVDPDYSPNTRFLKKKSGFSSEELESLLKRQGQFRCYYADFAFNKKVLCCVEVDNFTNETLTFVGSEERHGCFVYTTETKDIAPGYRFLFVTRKQSFAMYGVAVMCAWKFQNSLICFSWQVPLSTIGGLNSICFGITKPDITFEQISQSALEQLCGSSPLQGQVIDYFENGRRSSLFEVLQKRTFKSGIENEMIKDKNIRVNVRMTKASECNLSIQIFPRNIHNFASDLIKHVTD